MVRSERTMGGFFQHRVRQRVESFQEPGAFLLGERVERRSEWPVAFGEPRVHSFARLRGERHHRPAAIGRILAANDEPPLLELAGELARRRQAEPERLGELAHAALVLDADPGEQADVPAAEPRLALGRGSEPEGWPPPPPEPAQHPVQRFACSRDLLFCYHWITIIGDEVKGGECDMRGHHHHDRFGRRGFPNREQLVERLQGYREHLKSELANVDELLERLADAPAEQPPISEGA